MLISWLFIPLLSHLITNQVSIWSLRSSQAHPHRCSYSDSGNSATASIVGPAPLDPSQDRGGHQQEEWSRHPDRWSLGPYPPHLTARTLCSYKCVCVTPGTVSSLNPSIARSYPNLLLDSCMATGKANVDSPASPVNTPHFPSCPSLFRI
jgi:hypothetical protein